MDPIGRVVWTLNVIAAVVIAFTLVALAQPEPTAAPAVIPAPDYGYEVRDVPAEWEAHGEPCPDGRPHVGTYNPATGRWIEVHCR